MAIYWACFTSRPDNLARVLEWVGSTIKVHFLVGRGQRSEFIAQGLENNRVIERGSATDCFKFACSRRQPVLFMADDVMHLQGMDSSPAAWINSSGRLLSPVSVTAKMKREASLVKANLVGLYPKASPLEALQLPQWQLTHFIVADFCLIMPGFQAKWTQASWPKEDLDYSAEALVQHGCTVRLNRILIDAEHHQPGGDGTGKERQRADEQAAKCLTTTWNAHCCVFKKGRNNGEVVMHEGLASFRHKHPDVAAAIEAFNKAA